MRETWDEVATWLARRAEAVIDTSCARIHLEGERAWKIKRPVRMPFLDFSSVDKRRWALHRELTFNARWGDDIYRAVRAITREDGDLAFEGSGEPVEWVLEMRRFQPDAVLGESSRRLERSTAEALGRLIARVQAEAAADPGAGGARAISYAVGMNEASLQALKPRFGSTRINRLIDATRAARDAVVDLLETRQVEGYGRHCHGDLHLGNILLEAGTPVLFDCIEFNDDLSRIDVLYDVAFTLMDPGARRETWAANAVLNTWLDQSARSFPPSLWQGLAALPLFLSVRAAVRAHVSAATGQDEAAGCYLEGAFVSLETEAPRLMAVGGLSGSGKSTHARAMAIEIAASPGAVILRSDEIRKRLWETAPLTRLPAEAYASSADTRVLAEMERAATDVLATGRSVVLDATFLDPDVRRRVEALASRAGAPFEGVWLEAPAETLRARLESRRGDPSDADAAVLERQLARDTGDVTWSKLALRSSDA